ncbi:hypothetical protein [Paraburkholderia youngii]|uniref:hypothetical protein n=1 Tax=Paraburkholderia youngii TaxID=2782701 RepID=UPI001D9AEE6A|nr:hypothetical protein [Paraburkholderia youngii]
MNQRDVSPAIPYSGSFNPINDLRFAMTRSLPLAIERRTATDALFKLDGRCDQTQSTLSDHKRMTASLLEPGSPEGAAMGNDSVRTTEAPGEFRSLFWDIAFLFRDLPHGLIRHDLFNLI